ncbi:hypothetical protein [Flammeovirga sp. SJP92]|uniref:hypothetical protein n=1 Tax=Flammeovirga sp. SJP92 TaxID=1775430 RepID=UPI0012F849C1|nr:hypothetical protein [Flammeovirga sp. SJP92]
MKSNWYKVKIANFLIVYLFISCHIKKNAVSVYENKYDILIRYSKCDDAEYDKRLSKDSLHLYIEEGFNKDEIEVMINDKLFFKDSITTSEVLGMSEHLILGHKKNINKVSIRLNNSKALITGVSVERCLVFIGVIINLTFKAMRDK